MTTFALFAGSIRPELYAAGERRIRRTGTGERAVVGLLSFRLLYDTQRSDLVLTLTSLANLPPNLNDYALKVSSLRSDVDQPLRRHDGSRH